MKYAYIDSKLNVETTAVQQHKREKYDGKSNKEASTMAGNVVRFSGRAQVQWRQGIN